MTQMKIGTKFNFNKGSFIQVARLTSVTYGKTYTISGHDEDGDAYFFDDSGEKNFAAAGETECGTGNGFKYVVTVND
jgi:hypothetical protein